MNESIDDVTIQFEDNGRIVLKVVDKVILSRGAWATVLFRYQEWRPKQNDYGPDKYSIRRYRKMNGEYRSQSKFTISSADQAQKIIDALNGWLKESAEKDGKSQR